MNKEQIKESYLKAMRKADAKGASEKEKNIITMEYADLYLAEDMSEKYGALFTAPSKETIKAAEDVLDRIRKMVSAIKSMKRSIGGIR